jgi:hypothetical protein
VRAVAGGGIEVVGAWTKLLGDGAQVRALFDALQRREGGRVVVVVTRVGAGGRLFVGSWTFFDGPTATGFPGRGLGPP